MDVLIVVADPELRGLFLRALPVLGHVPRLEAGPAFPEAVIVDAGPGLLVFLIERPGRRVLRKPFTLEALQEALVAV